MNVRSMTAYARQEVNQGDWSVNLELRSVNSRFLDAHIRLPKSLAPLEDRIRKYLKETMIRGRVDLFVTYISMEDSTVSFEPDLAMAREYVKAVDLLKRDLVLPGEFAISDLLTNLNEVILVREAPADTELLWQRIFPLLQDLVKAACTMAQKEAEALVQDISSRLDRIEELLSAIEKRAPERLSQAQETLRERIQAMVADISVDDERIAQEIAVLADRLDITEELVRARSHVGQFRHYLRQGGEVGRRLDFLVQEIFREVNTISSKGSDSSISQMVVEIKGELEKIREQVQNLV